jgi:hypothetical protein
MNNPNNTVRAILDAAEDCEKRGKAKDAETLRTSAKLITEMYEDYKRKLRA